jgi:hypothetical protein
MPCKKYIQVAGTQESRTLRSNQLVNEEYSQNLIKKQQPKKLPGHRASEVFFSLFL